MQNSSVIIAISDTGEIENSENELYPFLYPVPTLLRCALRDVMEQYELEGDRRFSDEVFEAGADYESAGAFLLGMDVGWLCTGSEAKIVGNLIEV